MHKIRPALAVIICVLLYPWGSLAGASDDLRRRYLCPAYGEEAALIAQIRDHGQPLSAVLTAHASDPSEERLFSTETMAMAIYSEFATLSPTQVSKTVTAQCIALVGQAVMTSVIPVLTKQEASCQAIGRIAQEVAAARDRGALLTDTLATFRAINHRRPDIAEWTERLNSAIIYDLYGSAATMPPFTARQILETICVTKGLSAVFTLYGLMPDAKAKAATTESRRARVPK